MLFDGGFTFGNFIADAFTIFMFILWFWLLIVVSGDLFRRHDVSGIAKVLWVIAFVLFSYLGVFAYLLTQGRGASQRGQGGAAAYRRLQRRRRDREARQAENGRIDHRAGIRPAESEIGPVAAAARTAGPNSHQNGSRKSRGHQGGARCASIAEMTASAGGI